MAVTLATLVQRTRLFLGDWPEEDAVTASVASNATQITVADESIYTAGWLLELDQENMVVTGATTGTTVDVRRGARGSTAASHVNATIVLIRPAFLYSEIVNALNWAKDECFPLIYKDVLDTSLSTSATAFEYTVPSLGGVPIRYISQVEVKPSGETDYRRVRGWSIRRGATPKIQFKHLLDAGGVLRVHGFSPFPDLATGGSTDAQFPDNAASTLVSGAASYLLASGEVRRVREDVQARDSREQANRTGSSMSAANALDARFRRSMLAAAMPPLPKHAKPTF